MLSIIIPNLNSAIINQTLDSLRQQTYDMHEAEILVIGQDASRLVVEDELVRFIATEQPVNAAVARNIGLHQARGDPLMFIDADCIAAPDWVAQMIACHHRGAAVIGGSVAFGHNNLWTVADNLSMFHDWMPFLSAGDYPILATLNMSVRRTVWQHVGDMNENLDRAQDLDWVLTMREHGYTLYFEPRAQVWHYPARYNFASVMKHWTTTGQYMWTVVMRHRELFDLPALLSNRWLMLVLAPWTAAFLTIRIYFYHRAMWQYLYILPLIYITKLAWCWGVFRSSDWYAKTTSI